MNYRHIVFVLPLNFQVANTKLAQLRSYEMVNLIISQYFDAPHMWAKVPLKSESQYMEYSNASQNVE